MPDESPLRALQAARIVRIGLDSVEIAYDPDGERWFVRASSVPGLNASAGTEEELMDCLPLLVREARLP